MEELRKDFFNFLDERRIATLAEAEQLVKDERKDESSAYKAKANIYDIFKALWGAAEKATSTRDEFKVDFFKRAMTIPAAWEKSLEIAKQHDDTGKIIIEEAKLAAVKEIKAKAEELI